MQTHGAQCAPKLTTCTRWRGVCLGFAALGLALAPGCSNAKQGAVSGAGIGALTGLAIGSLSGNAGQGAAIGAIAGGLGGAIIGDQNKRRDDASAAATSQPLESSLNQADRDRLALARFARRWEVSGWETGDGRRHVVTGVATGMVERNYFVRLDLTVTADDKPGVRSEGSVVFGSEPGRGVTMSSRFNTSPMTFTYVGQITDDGKSLVFDEIAGFSPRGRRVTIRFLSSDEFVADVTDTKTGGQPQASLRFVGARSS